MSVTCMLLIVTSFVYRYTSLHFLFELKLFIFSSAEYPITLFGSIEAGLKVTTVSPGYTPREMAHQLEDCGPKAIFCEVYNYDTVQKACDLAGLTKAKIIVLKSENGQSYPSGTINFEELADPTDVNLFEASKLNSDANLDEFVILPYSSGTTGLPKGVMHSHKSFIANSEQMSQKMFTKSVTLPTTNEFQDVLPCFLPFYHIYGLNVVLHNKLSRGVKIISMRNYNINHFLDILPKHKATFLSLVPPIIIQLGNHPAAKPSHFESVRNMLCGAASIGCEDVERLLKK